MNGPSLITAAIATTWMVMAAWVFWAITSALVRAARDTAPSVSELAQRVVEMTTPDHTTEAA